MKYFKGSVASKTPGPVPERSISANQGLKFCSFFVFYLPMYCWDESHIFFHHFPYIGVKAQQYVLRQENLALLKFGLILG